MLVAYAIGAIIAFIWGMYKLLSEHSHKGWAEYLGYCVVSLLFGAAWLPILIYWGIITVRRWVK